MSGHPTRSGRHSLPPLSSILTPVTSRGQNTTGSGGRSRDSGAESVKSPLPTSLSLGNLRTTRYMSESGPNSTGPTTAASSTKVGGTPTTVTKEEKKDKKKRKKGMKGWAWVVEDENGNVIDLPSDEEIAFRNAANNEQAIRPPVSRTEEITSNSAPDAVNMIIGEDGEHLKADIRSPSSQASTTAREDRLLGKRPFKSSSPTRACSPQNLTESSSPKSMVYFTTISGEEPRRKVRRKSSPPTTAVTSTPAATSSNTTPVIMTIPIPSSTTTPTALPIAPKTAQSRRTQPSRQPPPPTRARAVVAQRDSASRAGSAHIVNDDAPLAVPPIRIGSGQGFNSHNKESAAKEELALRKEALFIIDQAEKMQATSYERGKRSGVNRRGGKRNGKADDVGNAHDKESVGDGNGFARNHDYSDDDNWASFEGPLEGGPTLGSRLSSQTAKAPPALPPPRPFEVEFEEVQEYYRQKAEVSRTSRLRERPWNERHSPAIVIATNRKDVMPRDETEREYYQGLSGLTEEMEANASGFVHNVRANVTALATYYFPQRQAKRDAFLERIGRGLQKLGQELTDNGDALVLP
ncbi:hypothetical protein C359_00297 [Cryptococcus neoformans Bt120]|nr:hypothetical protein C359_00297 [Cryptococcus neoformans var. grubii Bt120]